MQNRIANTSSYRNFQSLDEINNQLLTRPAEFILDCERLYMRTIDAIALNILVSPCPVVLLAGPSGSGKTTTARRLAEALSRQGVRAHTVELDNYFYTVDRNDLSIDWESPSQLDIPLILEHLAALSRGEEIVYSAFFIIILRSIFLIRSSANEPMKTCFQMAECSLTLAKLQKITAMRG